jgi:polysaccharide deacetylase family protein (PEP-CTERM system associated)
MRNALTIDLEDYYHVSAFHDTVAANKWDSKSSRVEQNTDRLLNCLDEAGFKATFFALGEVAEQRPHLIREVASRGHEIACHSLRHRIVYEMTPQEFREDTRRAKDVLEQLSGAPVLGYRAPSFSITRESLWALDILAELGFRYDSSIFPVRHPNYGVTDSSRFPYSVQTPAGSIVEFPLPTLQINNMRAPLTGGAYLRILPYFYTRWGIRHINQRELKAVCVYLHPWELDADQPRMQGPLTARLRHYMGLRGTETKLRNLLRDFEFCPMQCLVKEWHTKERHVESTCELVLNSSNP